MVAKHTKFTPDRFFGLFKLKLRHSEVDDIEDLVKVVKELTIGGYNIAQTILNSDRQREVFFMVGLNSWLIILIQFHKLKSNITLC